MSIFIQRLATARGIAVVCVALIFVFGAVIGFTVHRIQEAAELESRERARNATIVFAERVVATIGTIDSLLKVTARDLVNNPAGTTLASIVQENSFAARDLVLLTLVDAQGRVKETEQGPAQPISLTDREHIRVHLDRSLPPEARGLFIGKPVLGRVSKKWSVQLTRPVDAKDGSLAGILVASLDANYFARFWQKLDLSSADEILLTGTDAVVRMSSRDVESVLAAGTKRPDLVERAAAAENGRYFEQDASGGRHVSFFMKIPDLPLIVSTRVSMDAALAETRGTVRMLVAIGILVGLAILALSAVLATVMSRLAQRRAEAEELARTLEIEVRRRTAALEVANAELKALSVTDGLTALPNRRAFDARLRSALAAHARYGMPFSLLLLDIDRFKAINDEHGHGAGDAVLIGVGRILKKRIRETDFAARVGGEEFAVILTETSSEQARRFAEDLRSRIAQRRIRGLSVTATIGVTDARSGDRAASVYKRAAVARCGGAADGRDRVVSAEEVEAEPHRA